MAKQSLAVSIAPNLQPSIPPQGIEPARRAVPNIKRWHLDTWLAWRLGSGARQVATGSPTPLAYGGSQIGGLVRFDLIGGGRRPQAYLRAVHSPNPRQSDIAAGLGARGFRDVPVRIQAEIRASHWQGTTLVRPAVLAITEFQPMALPFGLAAEGYGQAGWIGGRLATGFVDAQARIDRQVAEVGAAKLRIGGGAWGGVQKSAGRVDVGPTLTLDLRETAVPSRLSVDYRYQIAGNARPGSGVAVTLSTGF
jgi:hypothetical protein